MVDLMTGKRQIFARVVEPGQPATVGVYTISEDAIEWAQKVLAAALLSGADWIVVDEIGPLELHRGDASPLPWSRWQTRFASPMRSLSCATRWPMNSPSGWGAPISSGFR